MKDTSCLEWDASTRLSMPAQRPHIAAIRARMSQISWRTAGHASTDGGHAPHRPACRIEPHLDHGGACGAAVCVPRSFPPPSPATRHRANCARCAGGACRGGAWHHTCLADFSAPRCASCRGGVRGGRRPPWLAVILIPGPPRAAVTFVIVLLALALTGWISAQISDVHPLRPIVRTAAIGVFSMTITYAAGHLFHP